ncbi:hypothetical protein SLE2022_275580 [Rubroshorea leprosula]
MPNGSLDKFIYNQGSPEKSHQLEIKTLYEIAIGIAQGLEYLHKGCNIRILHFDIKPHNILLDKSFCPKISDFGLAKSSETRDTIVSMTRGPEELLDILLQRFFLETLEEFLTSLMSIVMG